MRRLAFIGLLLLSTFFAGAQTNEELLERMNAIKLDTEHFLYGICTYQGENCGPVSLDEALKDLSDKVSAYCKENGFRYAQGIDQLPKDVIEKLSVTLYDDCVRSFVYIPKSALAEWENSQDSVFEDAERRGRITQMLEKLSEVGTLIELFNLFDAFPDVIQYGESFTDETQAKVDNGFLVYFDYHSGKILEIMTPIDAENIRHDIKTGAPADPLKYSSSPIWVYVEGLILN